MGDVNRSLAAFERKLKHLEGAVSHAQAITFIKTITWMHMKKSSSVFTSFCQAELVLIKISLEKRFKPI